MPSEAAATATSESLRNMVVSSRLKRGSRAIGEICCPVTPPTSEAFGRLKPTPAKLNETAPAVAEWVHNREITVIP
jgi:hypothetical protein